MWLAAEPDTDICCSFSTQASSPTLPPIDEEAVCQGKMLLDEVLYTERLFNKRVRGAPCPYHTHTHTQGKQKKHMVVNWVLCHLKQSDEICKHSTGPPGVVTWCLLHTTWLVDAYVGIWGRTPDWCFFATLYSHSVWKYSWQKQQFQRKNLMCKLHQSKKHRCDIQAEFSEPFHRSLSHCLTWKFHNDPVKSEIFQ